MLTLESGIIKENQKIECKYYELEARCQDIVKEYCQTSKEHLEEFQNFSKDYVHFRPYFDFVVCKLGYKILNVQMEEGMTLVGKENHMYVYKNEEKEFEENFRYGLSDDKTLEIYPMTMDSSTFHDCLIDGENNHLLPKDMYGHTQILQQILNLLLIANKEICEEFLHYTSDIGYFVARYLPLIRFQADKQGSMVITRCVYREKNRTEKQKMFMDMLLDNRYTFPSFLLKVERQDDYDKSKDISKDMLYKPGKIKKMLGNRQIVVLEGTESAQKDFLSCIQKHITIAAYSVKGHMQDILNNHGLQDDGSKKFQDFFIKFKNLTSNYNDFSYQKLLEQLLSFCESKNKMMILQGIDVEEVERLKNTFGGGVSTLLLKEDHLQNSENYDYIIKMEDPIQLELEVQTFLNQLFEQKNNLKH